MKARDKEGSPVELITEDGRLHSNYGSKERALETQRVNPELKLLPFYANISRGDPASNRATEWHKDVGWSLWVPLKED
ncbi:MAG: hypothetical protein Q8P59_12915 [Dehalococcoidia bacterium]|nr:hypothetical protein [Dehalococcoidia bacterium]